LLNVGDRLRTGKSSRATLRLSNQSILRVYELTTLEIQPPQAGHRTALNLQSGAAYFFDRDKPLETQFRTPSASGAIRGTEFNLEVDSEGRTELALLDGQVGVTNDQGSVEVKSGEQAVIEKGKAPQKSPILDAVNIIQWTLFYPGVIDPDELGLDDSAKSALGASLDAYRSGDLLQALAQFPDGRSPGSDAERVFRAALLLSVGQVTEAQDLLKDAGGNPFAADVQEIIAAVKGQPFTRNGARVSASDWLAGSYYAQAHRDLPQALQMAKNAAAKSPHFGFALERLAEMEFSFGHTDAALDALNRSLQASPRNAEALALQGFAFAAKNRISAAADSFDKAIAADGSFANGWLGRGLIRIKRNQVSAGRKDLETAAALEPNRAFLRSYLAKAWSLDQPVAYPWDSKLATRELGLAMKLDPNDPTAWLYSALLNDQRNCINQAIADLEHSQDLNGNRSVFRSKFLLDQDQAVRSANLALIYQDAGFNDVAVREATRAVEDDYANYSSHLFLADSYDALRDPRGSNLRYETPWENELLLANLLSPVSAGALSQNISQQEYSKLFQSDGFGVISQTEFFSQGAWLENASQFGTFGDIAYSLDYFKYSDPGFRPNNDTDQNDFHAKVKIALTEKDTFLAEVERSETDSGDVSQYYSQKSADPTLREHLLEDPSVVLGYHRQWSPGQDTLVLYRNLQESATLNDPFFPMPTYIVPLSIFGPPSILYGAVAGPVAYQDTTELNSLEVQHIFQSEMHRLILGARYQAESDQVTNGVGGLPPLFMPDTDFTRYTAYAYYQLRLFDQLRLTLGGAYDNLRYPVNIANPPVVNLEKQRDKFSPKLGIDWTPNDQTRLRAEYTRSAGGVFNSTSTLIEPSEVAGFNQAYRTLVSQVSTFPFTQFETYGVGFDYKFPTRTYVNIEARMLNSVSDEYAGDILNVGFVPGPGSIAQTANIKEKDLMLNVDQLIGNTGSVGLSYQLTQARAGFNNLVLGIPAGATGLPPSISEDATLQLVSLFANYYLPCGFFGRAELNWWQQWDAGFPTAESGDDFLHLNLYAGYRFPRRHVEIAAGILNVTDKDYTLDPLTYYIDPARRRTFVASLKFNF